MQLVKVQQRESGHIILLCFFLVTSCIKKDTCVVFDGLITSQGLTENDSVFFSESYESCWLLPGQIVAKKYHYRDEVDSLSGYWAFRNDTLFYFPLFFRTTGCTIGYPILAMGHWKKGRNYMIHFGPAPPETCFGSLPYFPLYYVYVKEIALIQGDRFYDLEIFSSNRFEFDRGRSSPPDDSAKYQKNYLAYKEHSDIYEVTRLVISPKRGILSLDRKRSLRGGRLPV